MLQESPVRIPTGWHQRPVDPNQVQVFTDKWFVDENCPTKADRTTVLLGVGPDPGFGPAPIPRPEHFDVTQGTGIQTDKDFADLACGMTTQSIVFTDDGKAWKASL